MCARIERNVVENHTAFRRPKGAVERGLVLKAFAIYTGFPDEENSFSRRVCYFQMILGGHEVMKKKLKLIILVEIFFSIRQLLGREKFMFLKTLF